MGSLRPPLELELPKRRRSRWWWAALGVSLAVHSLLLFGWVEGRLPDVPNPPRRLIVLQPLAESPRVTEMPFGVPRSNVLGRTPPRVRSPRRLPDVPPVHELARPERTRPDSTDRAAPAPPPVDLGRIGPDLGDGMLWVRPLPLPPRELARRLQRTHVELVDSAVTATIQAFLDSIAREPGADRAAMPSWTTEIGGKKYGLDGRNIYIAGLKIPAAVLALLPISGATNEQRAFDHTNDMLADLRSAASRATTADEFKDAIRQLRQEKQEEHDFERNRRTPPPPDLKSPPPFPVMAPSDSASRNNEAR